jgi:3'-phosphoadenosine 5'-phosphosulfate sulfotransferase (PAPS reductase)/FAD synthetase
MEYMRRHQIPINPAYKLYGSSGCYFCPFVEKPRHYLTLKRLHPSLFQKIFEAETVMRKGGTPWPRKSIVPLTEQTSLNVFEKN